MIDYYGMLTPPPGGRQIQPGDTVVFGFRIQAFVTRGYIVPNREGVRGGSPRALGIWAADGRQAFWSGQPTGLTVNSAG